MMIFKNPQAITYYVLATTAFYFWLPLLGVFFKFGRDPPLWLRRVPLFGLIMTVAVHAFREQDHSESVSTSWAMAIAFAATFPATVGQLLGALCGGRAFFSVVAYGFLAGPVVGGAIYAVAHPVLTEVLAQVMLFGGTLALCFALAAIGYRSPRVSGAERNVRLALIVVVLLLESIAYGILFVGSVREAHQGDYDHPEEIIDFGDDTISYIFAYSAGCARFLFLWLLHVLKRVDDTTPAYAQLMHLRPR